MGRPRVINEPARSYNLLISKRAYNALHRIAYRRSVDSTHQVSVAQLLREGADLVVEADDCGRC